MQRVSGHYLYQVGSNIHPLVTIKDEATKAEARALLYNADLWLTSLLTSSEMFRLRACIQKGLEFRDNIKARMESLDKTGDEAIAEGKDPSQAWQEPIGFLTAFGLRAQALEFENLLGAELQIADLYAVMKKRAFDTTVLAERGAEIFPNELIAKVPETAQDAAQAGRCLAFELHTAAGFHLHRVNEAVLRKYFDVVTQGKIAPPKERTIGSYLKILTDNNKGDPKVLEGLKALKDLYRNPLMHPEHTIETTDEAIALHGAIESVVVHMLKEIK